jgi:hypothetical protein
MSPRQTILAAALLLSCAWPADAQSVCASDGQPQPVALLERFVNADCDACWRDPATPKAGPRELALDWIVPGSKGDDAPLSMGASNDALLRLAALARKPPTQADARRQPLQPSGHRLRVAQGTPLNDYIGTSIALKPGRGGPWHAWLLLVEVLPAGAEGSPVPRNLVRNVFQAPWDGARPLSRSELALLEDARPMQIHEGTLPSRLRVVGLLEDMQGRIRAIARSECRPEGARR